MPKILFVLITLISSIAIAEDDGYVVTCGEETVPVSWTYCFQHDPSSQSRDVLYWFHGGGGDANTNLNAFKQDWKNRGVQRPAILTVSFGPFWFLTPKNGGESSGRYEFFMDYIVPMLEGRFMLQGVNERVALGFSMGGWNAAMVAIFKPEFFKRVAMAQPAILGVSPLANDDAVQAYAEKHGLTLKTMKSQIAFVVTEYATEADWQNYGPMPAAERLLSPLSPIFYISTAVGDPVYAPGGKEFAEIVQRKGAPLQHEERPGGHGDMNVRAVSKFLVP